MRGLLDMFENPLTLGGLGMLSGGGWDGAMSGMRMGAGMQDRRRQLAEEDQRKSAFDGLVQSGAFPKEMAPFVGAMSRDQAIDYLAKTVDPNTKLERQYKQAQINKLNREAATGDGAYGKSGAVVQGPDGKYYAVRYNSDGTERINPLQVGDQSLTPARGVEAVGDTLVNKATGEIVRNVGQNLAAGKEAEVVGRETGDRRMGLPKARATLRGLETQQRNVQGAIQMALPKISQWTTGIPGQLLSNLGGTEANNLRTTLNTIKANLGFDKLQDMRDNSPTGGALGQVAVAELEMLQSAWVSVEQSQTGQQLTENLQYLSDLLREIQENRRMAFDETYGAVGGTQPQSSPKPANRSDWQDLGNGVRIREKR